MDAVISGIAGIALMVEGDSLTSLDVEDLSRPIQRFPSDLPFLFGDARDLRVIENAEIESIASELQKASRVETSLNLSLIALDPDLSIDIRIEALEDLNPLLSDKFVIEHLESILYGRPLPKGADIKGAIECCGTANSPIARSLLKRLSEYQPSICEVSQAWDAIPTNAFGGGEKREEFQRTAVSEGLFRALVLTRETQSTVASFFVNASLNRSIQVLSNHRDILQRWSAPFRSATPILDIRHEADDELAERSLAEKGRQRWRKGLDRAAVLRNVESQKELIAEAMRRRDLVRVRNLVKELVEYQLKNGGPIYAAKSLCDLASEAKGLGIYSLQLELAEQSTKVKPDDAWSLRQYADALLSDGQPAEALAAYEQADALGGGAVARRGRAETLKALGRLNDALSIYDAVIADYPEETISRGGRADTLRALGRFTDALAAYDSILSAYPEDVFARTGRAATLKAMYRFNDALAAYDSIIATYPENVFARTGRAETLKAMGRLNDALAAYDSVIATFPEEVVARNGRADTLHALGRLDDALAGYDFVIATYPEDVYARSGRADTLKALGRLDEALAAYDTVIAAYPDELVARNGRSCILAALRRYDEALVNLPVEPATHQDWIGFHIRGMIMLRSEKLKDAIRIFEKGVAEDPTPVGRQYFQTTLAIALMRQEQYGKAERILRHVEAPELKPQVNVLLMHCFGEDDQSTKANEAFERISAKPWSISNELIEELHRRYVLKQPPQRSDDWVFDQEIGSILVVANQQAPISNYLY
ncbi:MAG: tetratricopeptide repeat protein [Pyrinomonadaceae bacterium]